jgi:predicted AlkP superfamily pyrophosphatase or phosphodiesterase
MSTLYRIAWCSILAFGIAVVSAAAPGTDRVAVMISVDGLAGSYLDDPQAEMPVIRELAAKGARAAGMTASTPTVTWPNHTTLVTGVNPARHGVVGNNYFDRAAGKRVVLISDPVYDKAEIVKVPTIYDLAKQAGLKTAAVLWPASRNASTLDWTTPDVLTAELIQKYTTPALLAECAQEGLELPKVKDEASKTEKHEPRDDRNTKIFNLILRKHHPQLGLLHLINVDHTQHSYGPKSPEAYAAIKLADQQVKEVWDTLQREYPARATLFILSDHGFSANNRSVLPNVVLRKAGLTQPAKNGKGPNVQVVVQGGCALLYVQDQEGREEVLKQIRKAFTGLEGVAKVLGPEQFKPYGVADPAQDPHAPDLLLFTENGQFFGDTASGDLPFADKPERKGSHGHDPNYPNLYATFVACGQGIKPGARLGQIRNLDVAPTVARILGIKMENVDGKALTAALE